MTKGTITIRPSDSSSSYVRVRKKYIVVAVTSTGLLKVCSRYTTLKEAIDAKDKKPKALIMETLV